MKSSLSQRDILSILTNAYRPLTLDRIAAVAQRQGVLKPEYSASAIQRVLDALVKKEQISAGGSDSLTEYQIPETDAATVSLERELDEPLIAWLAEQDIDARSMAPGGKQGIKGTNLWRFPDVVGCIDYRKKFDPLIGRLGTATGSGHLDLFSFEVKKNLTPATLRHHVLEGVSNSAWAHYRYVVCQPCDDEVREEVRKLSQTHGVGLIELEVTRVNHGFIYTANSEITIECPRRPVDLREIHELCFKIEWKPFLRWIREILD